MIVRAPQEIWGYEGLVDYRISETLNVIATYSYVEGKIPKLMCTLARQMSPPKATANVNWKPSDTLSLTVSYLYVGDRKRFSPNADGDYVGDQGPISTTILLT